ncbi:PAS domain S-box-containing protein [Skermanella aerolata]|uniref:sensor histidine kinase n=1 Tax=Skermanella aerolata TaxID=393310 RepID=UPI003D208282
MGERSGIWLIAAAAAAPGLLMAAASPMLDRAPDGPPAMVQNVGQVAAPASAGAIMPAGAIPGSPTTGAVVMLQPVAIAGLVAALVSGLLAAGAARRVMRNATARLSRAPAGGPHADGLSDAAGFRAAGFWDVSDERLRDMAEALPQIVWITSASGSIEYYSRRWFEYSGASPGTAQQAHWRSFVHGEDLERLVSSWKEAAAQGQPWQAEYRLRRADGTYRWHLGQAIPVTGPDGTILRWFGSATDIDGQKCVEAELGRTAAERARLLQQKDILLLEIQHRVRNNLQLISSLLSLQNRSITDPDTLQQFIEARGRIQTVAQVHEQLYLTDEPDRMDFAALLREMCLNQSKPGIDVNCRRNRALDLPIDEATPLALIANELISNAVEYAYPVDGGLRTGGGEVRVTLEGRSPGDVELRVEDDGIGLPPDLEGHRTSLGMRLVRQLTRQLRGEIETQSGEAGTRISIRFVSHPVPELDLFDGGRTVRKPGKSPRPSA